MSSHSFIGRMSKLNNRYWLVTEHTLILITLFFHLKHLIMTLNLKHCLSRFEIFRESNSFLSPTPLYTTQNRDLFNTYEEGFSMHKGQRNPLQLPEDEPFDRLSTQPISGKSVQSQNLFIFLVLNSPLLIY